MARIAVNLEVPVAPGRGEARTINKALGACSVSVAGMFTGKMKVEYAYDDRNVGGWTTTTGGEITGLGVAAWLDQVEAIPAHALKVSILCTGAITHGATDLRCVLIYDEGNYGG